MSRKKDSKNEKKKSKSSIKEETRRGVWSLIFFVLAIFTLLTLFGKGGVAGGYYREGLVAMFGIVFYILPIIFGVLGMTFARSEEFGIGRTKGIVLFILLGSMLGVIATASPEAGGGYLGLAFSYPFVALFDEVAGTLILGAILIGSLLIFFDEVPNFSNILDNILAFFKKPILGKKEVSDDIDEKIILPPQAKAKASEAVDDTEDTLIEAATPAPAIAHVESKKSKTEEFEKAFASHGEYVLPPLSLLEGDKGKPNVGDIKANANIIKRTLANFGILVEMDEITIGPSVTRYALKPAEGVKLSRILALQNDLALALAAHPIRIEAPIPGKALVGIEIPNRVKSTVGLATMLADTEFTGSSKPLLIALGKGLSGKAVFGNLAKMPHGLIAGTTGSGKSVTIHSVITSLLYRNGPDDLRFIFVDPKRVELTLYNGIPHLLSPVITEAKKCILALKWAAKEMDRRYDILEKNSVRDIASYHSNVLGKKTKDGEELDRMPYIVIIIDELADIMQAYPRELESAIVRLAQMSRAVGIHLILSTQRPSVNVITGLIKANVPTRVALQVSSQIDSRTILDMGGAEKLLGAGDMLYLSGEMSQPSRLQSAFIGEEEVKRVVKFIKDNSGEMLPGGEIAFSGTVSTERNPLFESTIDSDDGEEDDELYEDAREVVIAAGKASTSYLQRKLNVGYARAARLIDILEERGVVGPGSGAKPREVYEKPIEQARDAFNEETGERL
jgi:S-DNA-T family DNA segregation ATPase FtsK/SpoIIIE